MNVKYDEKAAERLIVQMYKYCIDMKKETQDLIRMVGDADKWQDNQKKAFETNVIEIAKDLNQALHLENEYMNVFRERVRELRG